MDEMTLDAYKAALIEAAHSIRGGALDRAKSALRRAVVMECVKPEAYNLLGVVAELEGDGSHARSLYRAALSLDPDYAPAKANLRRSSGGDAIDSLSLGEM